MKILVDADACPVKEIAIEIAKENNLEIILIFDNSHFYDNEYAKIYIIDKGFDAVDYFLLSKMNKNDIVITQDYGLASLVLTKGGHPINQNGIIFTNDNIDSFLESRFINAKIRKTSKHIKGPSKRTLENDIKFQKSLIKLVTLLINHHN